MGDVSSLDHVEFEVRVKGSWGNSVQVERPGMSLCILVWSSGETWETSGLHVVEEATRVEKVPREE